MTRKELLAVEYFAKYFKHCLMANNSLPALTTVLCLSCSISRTKKANLLELETLSIYEMRIEHRPGKQLANADALSRKSPSNVA